MFWLLPLVVAVLVAVPFIASPVSHWFDVRLTRLSLAAFGTYVSNGAESRRSQQRALLQAAHVGQTHRIYASRTLLTAAATGVVGAITVVYVVAGLLFVFGVDAGTMLDVFVGPLAVLAFLANLAELPGLGAPRMLGLFVVAAVVFGPPSAYLGYWGRWRYLGAKRNARETGIDATLPRTVAFVYALSRSGMAFTKVLETLERNQRVYGESAREISVAVRDIDTFNTDVLTALTRTAERTPSEGLEEFSDNLASVLDSGRNLPEFLHDQYERYRDEAESLQEQYLELLATLAEIYVTVLVAGPLFFITVLVVIGLVLSDTLTLIRVVTYLGLPLASVAFVVYADSITQPLRTSVVGPDEDDDGMSEKSVRASVAVPGDGEADGAAAADRESMWERNRERLTAYDTFEPVRKWAQRPFGMLLDRPEFTFALTVPLAIFYVLGRIAALPDSATTPELLPVTLASPNEFLSGEFVRGIDEPILEGALLVLAVYAVVHEVQKRRTHTIEQHVPDFLDRLAGVNEAGMTVTESLRRVRGSELGSLGPEIDRVWADIQWGSDARTALRRMERRTGSVLVSQAVALITNAMRASGDIAPVLRIAADEAQENRRLRRERRQEMLTYLIVIYISFFVFIGIITALSVAFIPAISEAGSSLGGGGTGMGVPNSPIGEINEVDTEAYSLLFFHVAAVQAVCSGFIAGQLGEGSIRDGAKHAAILLAVAYLLSVVVF